MLKSSSLQIQRISSRRFFSNNELFVYDPGHNGQRNSISGIRATIFGATGFTGKYVGAALGYISSDLVFPSTRTYRMDDQVKYLKLCANLGQSFIVREMNFKNPKMIERVMSTSNVDIFVKRFRSLLIQSDQNADTLAKRILNGQISKFQEESQEQQDKTQISKE